MGEFIFTKCYFFLDTLFLGFYTFVNCKVSLAGSMSTRQRENRENGNQESSSKEASEEGSKENSKEEVSRQRNKATQSGDAQSVPRGVFGQRTIASVHAAAAAILEQDSQDREGVSRELLGAGCDPLAGGHGGTAWRRKRTSGVWRGHFPRERSGARPGFPARGPKEVRVCGFQ
jgi:hypothetical protein